VIFSLMNVILNYMGIKQKNKNILLQGSILALAGIITKIIGFVYRIPMANMLGEEGNGIYSVAFGIYNVVLTLSSYSLPLVISKLISARLAKNEYNNSYKVFKNAFKLAVVVGIIAALCLYFGSGVIEKLYDTPGLNKPLKIMAPTVFVVALVGVFRGYFQGCSTMLPTAISQIIEQIANAIVSVLAIWIIIISFSSYNDVASYGAAGGTIGTFAGAFMALLFLSFVFVIYKSKLKIQIRRDKTTYEESNNKIYKLLLITILPIVFSQTIYQIAYTLDDFIFSNIMSLKGMTHEVRVSLQGVFNLQYTLLINVPIAIATAMAVSIIPNIVTLKVQGKIKEVQHEISTVIKFVMAIAFPSSVGFAVLAKQLMPLLFPSLKAYNTVAVNLLMFGSFAIVFYSLSTITSAVLQGLDFMKVPVVNAAISLVIHVVLVSVLLYITDLGVYALLIGDITFPLIVSILNWISVKKLIGYSQEITKTFMIPLFSSIVMGIGTFAMYKLAHWVINVNVIEIVIAIIFGVITYGFIILLLHYFSDEELYNLPMGSKLVIIEKKLEHYLKPFYGDKR